MRVLPATRRALALALAAAACVSFSQLCIFSASQTHSRFRSVTSEGEFIGATFDPRQASAGRKGNPQWKRASGNPLSYAESRQARKGFWNRSATRRTGKGGRFSTAATEGEVAREEKRRGPKEQKDREPRQTEGGLPRLSLSSGAALRDTDFAKYSPEDRLILESRVGVMAERARAVARACQETPPIEGTPVRENFIWDLRHKPSIVWCPTYKVASTTWMRNFLLLGRFNEHNPRIPRNLSAEERERRRFKPKYGATHGAAFAMYGRPPTAAARARALRESVRLIIVRHPFTRLLSAYRDKMAKRVPRPRKFRYEDLQRHIVATYRSGRSADRSPFPSFPEFVQFVIDSTRNFSSAADWKENVRCWVPYWAHCNVCDYDFNVIMKLETLEEDQQFLVALSHLDELKNKTSWAHLRGSSSSQLAVQFYKDLTRHQMLQLYKRYELDFKLFQYHIRDYLSVAKDA
nr:carbohydrate sulfotransferase 10-like [Penaeus vannamei]